MHLECIITNITKMKKTLEIFVKVVKNYNSLCLVKSMHELVLFAILQPQTQNKNYPKMAENASQMHHFIAHKGLASL